MATHPNVAGLYSPYLSFPPFLILFYSLNGVHLLSFTLFLFPLTLSFLYFFTSQCSPPLTLAGILLIQTLTSFIFLFSFPFPHNLTHVPRQLGNVTGRLILTHTHLNIPAVLLPPFHYFVLYRTELTFLFTDTIYFSI